jgi:hypothetical protein
MVFAFGPGRWWLRSRLGGGWQQAVRNLQVHTRRQRLVERLRLRLNLLAAVSAHLERSVAEAAKGGADAWSWRRSPQRVRLQRVRLQRLKLRQQLLSAFVKQLEQPVGAADEKWSPNIGASGRARQAETADYDE